MLLILSVAGLTYQTEKLSATEKKDATTDRWVASIHLDREKATAMTKRQTELIHQRLENKVAELSGNGTLRNGLVTEWSSDPMDQVQSRQDLDLTVHVIDSTWKTRKAIETAMSLLKAGEYGICLHCGEDINPKRLEAIPWTTLCVSCQEEHDLAESGSRLDKAA